MLITTCLAYKSALFRPKVRALKALNGNTFSGYYDKHLSGPSFGVIYDTKSQRHLSAELGNTEVICLVDLGVRTIDQIRGFISPYTTLSSTIPKLLSSFLSKSSTNNDNYALDKFLYTYDSRVDQVARVSMARIPLSAYAKLELSRRLSATHSKCRSLVIVMINEDSKAFIDYSMSDALLSSFQMEKFAMPSMKQESGDKDGDTLQITFINPDADTSDRYNHAINIPPTKEESLDDVLRRSSLINRGTNLARSFSSLPPNLLNPYAYTQLIRHMAAQEGWGVDVYTYPQLKDMGCGAFCAVIQGNQPSQTSPPSHDALIKLTYTPRTVDNSGRMKADVLEYREQEGKIQVGERRPLVLVGKGVCYDTGGHSLKPSKSMKTMKSDMAGSAVALGLFQALSQQGVPYPMECYLAIAENHLDKHAYRPDDVVTSVTGETIEVVDTDAEGRMLLADTLALASRHPKISIPSIKNSGEVFSQGVKPALILDFATLTGACITSLTPRYIGAMTNRDALVTSLIHAGLQSGERVWPFPIDDDLGEDLKSDIADTLQCRADGPGDHLYAAYFLKRFVNTACPWVHFDLASAYRPGGLGHVPSDYTGAGVRAAYTFLQHVLAIKSDS
eukprot:gene25257-30500_t